MGNRGIRRQHELGSHRREEERDAAHAEVVGEDVPSVQPRDAWEEVQVHQAAGDGIIHRQIQSNKWIYVNVCGDVWEVLQSLLKLIFAAAREFQDQDLILTAGKTTCLGVE